MHVMRIHFSTGCGLLSIWNKFSCFVLPLEGARIIRKIKTRRVDIFSLAIIFGVTLPVPGEEWGEKMFVIRVSYCCTGCSGLWKVGERSRGCRWCTPRVSHVIFERSGGREVARIYAVVLWWSLFSGRGGVPRLPLLRKTFRRVQCFRDDFVSGKLIRLTGDTRVVT